MAKLRPCSWCKGSHKTKKAAKKCYDRTHKGKVWTAVELGR